MDLSDAKGDVDLLKNLPKVKVQATWAPWTYGRLTFASGYGAGITSPGWYAHVWQQQHDDAPNLVVRWLARVAAQLRTEGLDVSSAHLIETTRLAETLAAMRELNEAVLSVMLGGNALPMQLIARKLIVGEVLGHVPDEAPTMPLLQDLQRESKRLRLAFAVDEQVLELDLRKPNDLDRSRLFHRLNVLGVAWATVGHSGGKGTFRETWKVAWQPELAPRVGVNGIHGQRGGKGAVAPIVYIGLGKLGAHTLSICLHPVEHGAIGMGCSRSMQAMLSASGRNAARSPCASRSPAPARVNLLGVSCEQGV